MYDDNVVLPSISSTSLKMLLNKLYEFCTSSSFEINLAKTKIMIFGCNKRKLNQEAFYLDKDQIEIIHEDKYIRIDFYSHGYFEPFIERQGIAGMRAFGGNFKDKNSSQCHVLGTQTSHVQGFRLPTSMYGCVIWRGNLENSHWQVFEKDMKMHTMSHVKLHSLTTDCILLAKFGELPIGLYVLKLTMGFQQRLFHPSPSRLVNRATSLSQHPAEQGCNIWYKLKSVW